MRYVDTRILKQICKINKLLTYVCTDITTDECNLENEICTTVWSAWQNWYVHKREPNLLGDKTVFNELIFFLDIVLVVISKGRKGLRSVTM